MSRLAHRRTQGGVALIVAVLVLALASLILLSLLDAGELAQARTRNQLRAEQSWQLQLGLEAWAAQVLREDARLEPNVDGVQDIWAQPLPPLEIDGGRIGGRLRELGGCFNVNNLFRDGEPQVGELERFERLLRVLGINPLVAAQALDWIDPDQEASAGGAEDAMHAGLAPARRTANRPLAHVSELRLLPGLEAEAWQRLQPHVCALPEPTPTNLNTASTALWMSLQEGITLRQAEQLSRQGTARYRDLDEVSRELVRLGLAPLAPGVPVSVSSGWFVLEADILLDDLPFAYSSLLQRRPEGVVAVARSRGRL